MINKLRKNGGKRKKRIAINRKWKACTFEFVSVDFQLFRPIPVSFDQPFPRIKRSETGHKDGHGNGR